MIRLLAFSAALRGTAALSWLVPQALRFTRWLAPAGIRAEVDCKASAGDAELVEVCGAIVRLTADIEAAWDTRDTTTRTIEQGKAFERSTIRPLMQRRRLLAERANTLAARTLCGHQARARMVLAWRGGVPPTEGTRHEAEPAVWALARDLAA